jgi:hypothetical protein
MSEMEPFRMAIVLNPALRPAEPPPLGPVSTERPLADETEATKVALEAARTAERGAGVVDRLFESLAAASAVVPELTE